MHAGLLTILLPVWIAYPQVASAPNPSLLSTAPVMGTPHELIPELQSIMAEAKPLLVQLRALEQSYENPGVIRKTKAERERLRSGIESRVGRMTQLYFDFEERRHLLETIQIQGVISRFMGGVMPRDPLGDYNRLKALADFSHVLLEWQTTAQGQLNNEDVAYKGAERLLRIHEALTGAAGVMFVLLVAALLYGRRNAKAKAKLETDITRLVAASGSVYQGIGGPSGAVSTTGVTGAATVLGGNYVIDKELGRGGMGIVYEATDLSLRRKVAVKKLREELHERPQELEMLLTEARLVASLKHPNIVEIHSIFKENGRIYLVFEYVSGRTLADVLEQSSHMAFRQAKGVLRQIAQALDYAHGQRVIHRDLKPANVMITAEGVVKVMDFGIAHQSKATLAKQTRSEAWGTPPYMAPEQELGKVSKESDLYALGACLYEMTTGKMPFDGPNYLAQKDAMDYRRPSTVRPGVPAAFDAVIARALAPDPTYRFHSGAELAAAMDALPDGA